MYIYLNLVRRELSDIKEIKDQNKYHRGKRRRVLGSKQTFRCRNIEQFKLFEIISYLVINTVLII